MIFTNDFYDEETDEGGEIYLDRYDLLDSSGRVLSSHEFEDLETPHNKERDYQCGAPRRNPETGREDYVELWSGGSGCAFVFDVVVPRDDVYEIAVVAWSEPDELYRPDGRAKLAVVENPYRWGDTWYGDMREPGFDGGAVADADTSLMWLSNRVVRDDRFAEATVRFWWPSIMGEELAEPPEDEKDADFEGRLLESNAQSAEISELARGFRRGFRGRSPYNLRDLLVEIVLSPWFRAGTLSDGDPVRATALRSAGARRLLTPEELARKTVATTGFQWGRTHDQPWLRPSEHGESALTDGDNGYRVLYGGIDSAGVTERARDMTSIMAGIAQSHALESSCPIVMKDFYLLPDGQRHLFAGTDLNVSPIREFSQQFDIVSESWRERDTLRLTGQLVAGPKTVAMRFVNDYNDDDGDRNIRLYRLRVVTEAGRIIYETSLKDLVPPVASWGECGRSNNYNSETGNNDHFWLYNNCAPVTVDVDVPREGAYSIEVETWADQHGGQLARLEIGVESDTATSAGSRAIRTKLVELHDRLLGRRVTMGSREVNDAYDLYVDVWSRKSEFDDSRWFWQSNTSCDWWSDQHFLDGILDDAFVWHDDQGRYSWDWDRVNDFLQRGDIDWSDPQATARTWVVVLAYLLMDYRYLHL